MKNKENCIRYERKLKFDLLPLHNRWRLDKLLIAKMPWYSRNEIHKYIDKGEFTINGRVAKKGSRVNYTDNLVRHFYRYEPKIDTSKIDIDIVYEDESILVVNKPPVIAVHPNSAYQSGTMIQILKDRYNYKDIRLVHRLDKETSGLMLLAKTKEDAVYFMHKFINRNVEKRYLALVNGIINPNEFSVKIKLGLNNQNIVRIKNVETPDGVFSHTDFKLIKQYKNYALVEAFLKTGRQHQIRAHLSWYGNYIVGDKIYGVDETIFDQYTNTGLTLEMLNKLLVDHHLLHAWKLSFYDDRKQKFYSFKAKIPTDMINFIKTKAL